MSLRTKGLALAGRGAMALGRHVARRVMAGRGGALGHHHRRGISHSELRGFRKVTGLLRSVGMRPKGLGGHRGGYHRKRYWR